MITKTKPRLTHSRSEGWERITEAPEREIALSAIADSPFQLRKSHNEDLAGLRDTLVTHGLLQAVVVRPIGKGRYELLAGHRRCAAARLAGWKEIRARIQEASDDDAREIVVIENLLRKDLSAVEEAKGFQAMLAGGHYATQEEIAQRIGCTQGHVANRLRYLRLPPAWQEAIISGEIPHTYARAVLPYCEEPRVAAAVAKLPAKLFGKKGKNSAEAEPLSYEDLCWELNRAFQDLGFNLFHNEHDKKTGRWVHLPSKLSDELRKKLDVISISADDGEGGRDASVVMNKAAWWEVAREHAQRKEHRHANLNAKKRKAEKPAAEMTPAERKAAAAEEAKNKKKRQEQLERRRGEIAADWKRLLIAEALADPKRTGKEVLAVCLYYQTQDWKMDRWPHGCDLQEVTKSVTGQSDLLGLLAAGGFNEAKIWDVARASAVQAFVDEEKNPMSMIVDDCDLDAMIAWLKIDLASAWADEQMGVLSEAWWNAYDRAELGKIGGGICVDSHMKKGEAVNALINCRSIPFPTELRLASIATKG